MNNNYNTDNINWEDIILRAQAFARKWVKNKAWFRVVGTGSFLKGKTIDDYVYGAIDQHLRFPEKFNPERADLLRHITNLICSSIANDVRSAENKTTQDVFGSASRMGDNEGDAQSYLESISPHVEASFIENIDYVNVMSFIEERCTKDPIVENIFVGLLIGGLKRREIIHEFKMSENDYDNGRRRLQTILDEAVDTFKIEKQPL